MSVDELFELIHVEFKTRIACECCSLSFSLDENSASRGVEGVFRLLQRPWFTRLWTVQELANADRASFFYGSHSIDSDTFQHAACECVALLDLENHSAAGLTLSGVHKLYSSTAYLRSGSYTNSLLKTFEELSAKEATDPRDRVFAVLGLVQERNLVGLNVDYDMTTAAIYREAVTHILSQSLSDRGEEAEESHPARVLALAGRHELKSLQPDLPSWVPYFHDCYDAFQATHGYSRKSVEQFVGSYQMRAKPLAAQPNVLVVK